MSKDYEYLTETSGAIIYAAMIRLVLKRLAQATARTGFDLSKGNFGKPGFGTACFPSFNPRGASRASDVYLAQAAPRQHGVGSAQARDAGYGFSRPPN